MYNIESIYQPLHPDYTQFYEVGDCIRSFLCHRCKTHFSFSRHVKRGATSKDIARVKERLDSHHLRDCMKAQRRRKHPPKVKLTYQGEHAPWEE